MSHKTLEKLRLLNNASQEMAAEVLEVPLKVYQSWESGKTLIPDDLELTTVFHMLYSNDFAVSLAFEEVDWKDIAYFGEASFHFVGGGEPLSLSISYVERDRLRDQYADEDNPWLNVITLDNQFVLISREHINDLYISYDGCATYGPETYSSDVGKMTGRLNWHLFEKILTDDLTEEDEKDYDAEEIAEIEKLISFDFERALKVINDPQSDDSDPVLVLNNMRERFDKEKDFFKRRALYSTWQYANGTRRTEHLVHESCEQLADSIEEYPDASSFTVTNFDDQEIFINQNQLDYIAIPLHRYRVSALIKAGYVEK